MEVQSEIYHEKDYGSVTLANGSEHCCYNHELDFNYKVCTFL